MRPRFPYSRLRADRFESLQSDRFQDRLLNGSPHLTYHQQELPVPPLPGEAACDVSTFCHTPDESLDFVPIDSTKSDEEAVESVTTNSNRANEIGMRDRKLRRDGQPTETRTEKLARIRAEIESGAYDTDEKLEAAVDRMLDSILGQR